MAYDFHVFSVKDSNTGLNSPLYPVDGDPIYFSVSGLLDYYISVGLTKSKTVMGIPTYGRSYKLKDAQNNGIHVPAVSKGDPGPYRHLRGIYSYADVCVSIQNSAKVVRDSQSHGVYLYKGDNWVAYDDPTTVAEKTRWAVNQGLGGVGLGGVGVWSMALDDISGVCGSKFPLMMTIRNALQSFDRQANTLSILPQNRHLYNTRVHVNDFNRFSAAQSDYRNKVAVMAIKKEKHWTIVE